MPYSRRSVLRPLHPKVKPAFGAIAIAATALIATYASTHKVDSAELGALVTATFAALAGYITPSGPYAAPVATALAGAEAASIEAADIIAAPVEGPVQV